jgi:LmbE family N-acetylglucosaminyl deacetylase
VSWIHDRSAVGDNPAVRVRRITAVSRRDFLACVALLPALLLSLPDSGLAVERTAGQPKILLVVAHPDDEYTFAATVYRVAKELGGTVDELVITNGAGGYHYSTLSEPIYGIALTEQAVAQKSLPEIRRKETLAAGRILGIGKHYFLNQEDAGFTLDPNAGPEQLWDTNRILSVLTKLLTVGRYQFVLTLLPTAETHGHHQAATWLVLKAVAALPAPARPAVLGGDPGVASVPPAPFTGNPQLPMTAVWPGAPVFTFDRNTSFGFHHELNYQIVVNWMIAEHKSQGLFQLSANKHDVERYWLFKASGPESLQTTTALFEELRPH